MGSCTITGGMFSTVSYSAIRGVHKLSLLDVYLPGCLAKPEEILNVVMKLHKKISREIYEYRFTSQ
ncbi:hypothetical protein AMTRI_Chr07g27970 [Amborella trichopoda]